MSQELQRAIVARNLTLIERNARNAREEIAHGDMLRISAGRKKIDVATPDTIARINGSGQIPPSAAEHRTHEANQSDANARVGIMNVITCAIELGKAVGIEIRQVEKPEG